MFSSLRKLIRNFKTAQNGEEFYGKLIGCHRPIQGIAKLEGNFLVYIPSENRTEVCSELIGMIGVPIGAFFKLKYYENDINIISKIELTELPFNSAQILNEFNEKVDNNDIIRINREK